MREGQLSRHDLLKRGVTASLGAMVSTYTSSTRALNLKEIETDPGSLRIALATATPSGTPLDPQCERAALGAAKLFESLGHKVEESRLPIDNALMRGAVVTVVQVSIARALDDASSTLGRAVTEQEVEAVTWARMQAGRNTSSVTYSRAIATLHQIGLAMAKFHQAHDIVLSPTLAKPPVPLGVLSLSQDLARFGKEAVEFSPYTALYNVTGQPSMSVRFIGPRKACRSALCSQADSAKTLCSSDWRLNLKGRSPG